MSSHDEYEPGWISLEEAKSIAIEEWWNLPQCQVVEIKQYREDGPPDKPIWIDEDGSMYLGEWREKAGKWHWHGLGVCYNHKDESIATGFVHVGSNVDDNAHGHGEIIWLKSSQIWQQNRYAGSIITTLVGDNAIPFNYKGNFKKNFMGDKEAVVTLKDGTTRVGPWANGYPIGNWHKHRLLKQAATVACADTPPDGEQCCQLVDEAKVPANTTTGSAMAQAQETQMAEATAKTVNKSTQTENTSSANGPWRARKRERSEESDEGKSLPVKQCTMSSLKHESKANGPWARR